MNSEHTTKNIFTYIKTHYGENILFKIQKLEKTMIKYSSYTNRLRFSLERSKIVLQRAGKGLLQDWIYINHVIRGSLKSSIEQLNGEILESKTPQEFRLVERIHKKLYKKSFESTKKETYTKI